MRRRRPRQADALQQAHGRARAFAAQAQVVARSAPARSAPGERPRSPADRRCRRAPRAAGAGAQTTLMAPRSAGSGRARSSSASTCRHRCGRAAPRARPAATSKRRRRAPGAPKVLVTCERVKLCICWPLPGGRARPPGRRCRSGPRSRARISGWLSTTPPGRTAGKAAWLQRTSCTAGEPSSSAAAGCDQRMWSIRSLGRKRAVGDAVAVEIEGRVVGPVVAAPLEAPFDVARAHVFHLVAVADEGVAGQRVALRAGGEVDADLAALEAVVVDQVAVGVVDEGAFLGVPPRTRLPLTSALLA
jgi:hypothetical protein